MAENYTSSTEFLQALADEAMLETSNTKGLIRQLTDSAGDKARLRDPTFSHTVNRPTLAPPPQLSEFLNISDNSDAWLDKLNADAAEWLDRYFPALDDCLRTLPEDFLCGVIGGTKPFGLDATVFELVWHRARDRAYDTLATAQRGLESAFTGRGFSLPPGAMAAQMADASDKAAAAIAEVSREQAIKDAEIKLELLKFAEEQALNYKRGVLSVLADFMRQWISLPDKDIERARLQAQASASLYAALSSYYNVEVAFEELRLKVAQSDADVDLGVDRNRVANAGLQDESGKAAALGQAARAFADIASQAAAGASTLVAEIESV